MESPLDPPNPPPIIDIENAFLLYAVFCGDVARTAHALSVPPELVQNLARENKWDEKLKPIIDLKGSTRAGDVERAINRALNFAQAHRLRLFLQGIVTQMTKLSADEIGDYIFGEDMDKAGRVHRSLKAKGLADLASAVEKCHAMTYLALSDTASDRKERGDDGSDAVSAAEMHIQIAEAMQKAGAGSIRGLVLEAQLAITQDKAATMGQASVK